MLIKVIFSLTKNGRGVVSSLIHSKVESGTVDLQGYETSVLLLDIFSLLNVNLAAAATCVCRQHGRLLLRPYLKRRRGVI